MGLFDGFRQLPPADVDLVRRIGRLEAEVETLRLQWHDFKDVLNRMVNRLEKREQRAAEREARESPPPATVPELDATSARVLARRNAMRGINGLSES